MSVLKVANVHLETTGTNRIDYDSNGFTRIVSGGTGGIVINTGGTEKINVGTNVVISSNANVVIEGTLTVSSNTISVNGQNVSPVQSFRNKIINGNFDFWQRGTSVTGVSSGQYFADRWVSVITGTTANVSRQAFTLGQTDVPGEPTYFHRVVVTSVANTGNRYVIFNRIESVRTLAGQTATLSFWAKADASKNIAVEFGQNFGTGGSPSSGVIASVTTCALTTVWTKFIITVNLPSITSKTLGSDNNDYMALGFWFDAGSNWNSRTNSLGQQSGTFDIAQVQLEAGSVATPFEMRPIGTELALCQRYYENSYHVGGSVTSNTGVIFGHAYSTARPASFSYQFLVSKRTTPSMTIISPATGATGNVRNDTTSADNPINSLIAIGQNTYIWEVANGMSAGNQMRWHYSASAEL